MGIGNGKQYTISVAANLAANVKTDLQAQLNKISGLEIDVDVKSGELKSFIRSLEEIQKLKNVKLNFVNEESIASAQAFGVKIGENVTEGLRKTLAQTLNASSYFKKLQENIAQANTAINRVSDSYSSKLENARKSLARSRGITDDLSISLSYLTKTLKEFKEDGSFEELSAVLQRVSPAVSGLKAMFDNEKLSLKELNDELQRHIDLLSGAATKEEAKANVSSNLSNKLKDATKNAKNTNTPPISTPSTPSPRQAKESGEAYYLRLRKAQITGSDKRYKVELNGGNKSELNAYDKLNKYIDDEIAALNLSNDKKKELEKALELNKKKSELNQSLAKIDRDAKSKGSTDSTYLKLSKEKLANSINLEKSLGNAELRKIYQDFDKKLDKRISNLSISKTHRQELDKSLISEKTRADAQIQQIQSQRTSKQALEAQKQVAKQVAESQKQAAKYQKEFVDNYKGIINYKKQLDSLDAHELEQKKAISAEIKNLQGKNSSLISNGNINADMVKSDVTDVYNKYKSSKSIVDARVVDTESQKQAAKYQKEYVDNYKKIINNLKALIEIDNGNTDKYQRVKSEIGDLVKANEKLIKQYGVKKESVLEFTNALDKEYKEFLKLHEVTDNDTKILNSQSEYLKKYEEMQKNKLLFEKNRAKNPTAANAYNIEALRLESELKDLEAAELYDKYRYSKSFTDSRAKIDSKYEKLFSKQEARNKFDSAKNLENQIIVYDKLSNRLTEYFGKYQDGISQSIPLTQQYNTLLERLNNRDFVSVHDAQNAFAKFRIACREAGVEVDTFYSKLKRRVGTIVKTSLIQGGLFQITSQIRQMVQNVIELDTAMTELRKVTNATEADYTRFLTNANTRARGLGATLTETVNATADFARLGYNIDDASTLANAALIYSNVGDDINSIDDATNSIISTMQAYGYEVDNVMNIVDKFNEVGNNFATSSGDIGEGLQRSAAALQAAGNTIDESIALFTAAQTTTQDADVVGTALKTVSMRLRGATTNEMDAEGLDVEGMANSTASLRKELKALTNVDIMLDDTTFKSTYQILTEIAKVWDEMNDVSQASALELMFGKRQGSIGAAILQNVGIAEDAYATSLNAVGSAEKENAVYLESIQGRLDKLTASYQVLSSDLIGSDLVKSVVSGATTILDILDGIANTLGSLPTLIGAASLAFSSYTKDYVLGKYMDVTDPNTGKTSNKFVLRSQVADYAYRDSKYSQFNTDKESLSKYSAAVKDAINNGSDLVDINNIIAETMSNASSEAKEFAVNLTSTYAYPGINKNNFKEGLFNDKINGFVNNTKKSIDIAFANNSVRDSKYLSDAGVEQIRKYNAALKVGGKTLEEFRANMQNLDPVAQKLINDFDGQSISADFLTNSIRNGSIANRLYSRSISAVNNGNTNTARLFRVLAGVARTTTGALDALGISVKSIAASFAFTAAITAASKVLSYFASKISDAIHRTEILREKAEESVQAFKDASDNLQSYKNELSSIQEKIDELSEKGSLTLTEEEELQKLKNENAELERKVKYYEILSEQTRRQATDDAVSALNSYNDGLKNTATGGITGGKDSEGSGRVEDQLSDKLSEYKSAVKELEDLENQYISADEDDRYSISKKIKDQESAVSDAKTSLISFYDEINTIYEGITKGDSDEGDVYLSRLSPILNEIINELYAVEDAADSANDAVADVGKDTINKTINNINGAAKGFESLNKIYDDIRDSNTKKGVAFDFTSLVDEDFTSTFSKYTTEYNNFIRTIANSPNNLSKCQSAFNKLVTAWVDGSGALDNLDEANKNVAIQMLKNMGITNATAVVESKLTQAKLKEVAASALSAKSSEARIEAFNKEIVAMGLTQTATEKLQTAFKNAETAKTELLKTGISTRLKLTREEIASFQSSADVLNWYSGKIGKSGAGGSLKNAHALNRLYTEGTAENTLYSYAKYLDAIDAAIAEVSNVNTTISSYKPADTSSGKTELPKAYQRALAKLKHQREMDEIDAEEYYEKLEALRKKYLDGVNIDEYMDENRSVLEEIYNGYKEVIDDYISKRESWISDRDKYQDWGPDDDAEKEWLRIIDKINDAALKGLLSEKQKAELLEDAYRNAYEARLDLMSEHKDALQDVIDLTVDLYKQENEDLKEALEDQRDIYKEIIDAKKEALDLAESELSYQEEVKEKVKEISKLQNQYDVLSLDDSREAAAKRATISDEITELQDELAKYQREHNVDATQTMLDEQYEKYEESIDDELDTLDDALDDAYEMIRISLNRIETDSDGLYNDLITWNRKYGSGIDSDVTNSWNVAIDAVKRYKESVDGINSASDVYDYLNHETDDSFAQRGKNFSKSPSYNNATTDGNIQEIADKVRANLGSGNKLRLVNKDWNSPSGTQVGDLVVTGGGIYLKTANGGKKIAPLNTAKGTSTSYAEVKSIYEAICKSLSINGYSKGGVVPYTGLAMLHGSKNSAETIFNAEQSKKLYNLINANTTESLLSKIFKKSADAVAKNGNLNNVPTISLSINSPINIEGGADKTTIAELDKYSEKLANKITQQITSAFSIRGKGIKPSFSSL